MTIYFEKQPVFISNRDSETPLIDWKECQDSFTDKLKTIKGSVELQLLFQNWVNTTWWDACALQITDSTLFQREIMMKHEDKEYWYARSIIPRACYETYSQMFQRLEQESIRNLIFEEKQVVCTNRICYPIDKHCIEFYWVKKYVHAIDGVLWVRLAEYTVQGSNSFYVIEILLPELERVCA